MSSNKKIGRKTLLLDFSGIVFKLKAKFLWEPRGFYDSVRGGGYDDVEKLSIFHVCKSDVHRCKSYEFIYEFRTELICIHAVHTNPMAFSCFFHLRFLHTLPSTVRRRWWLRGSSSIVHRSDPGNKHIHANKYQLSATTCHEIQPPKQNITVKRIQQYERISGNHIIVLLFALSSPARKMQPVLRVESLKNSFQSHWRKWLEVSLHPVILSFLLVWPTLVLKNHPIAQVAAKENARHTPHCA